MISSVSPVGGESFPQLGDVESKRAARALRGSGGPERVDEAIDGYHRVGVDEQYCQQGALLERRDGHVLPRCGDLKRSQNPELPLTRRYSVKAQDVPTQQPKGGGASVIRTAILFVFAVLTVTSVSAGTLRPGK